MRSSKPRCSTSSTARWRNGRLKTRVDLEHDGFIAIHLGEDSLQRRDLRQIVVDDVGIVRIVDQKILMITLGRIETVQRLDSGHDRIFEGVGGRKLGNIGARDLLLHGRGEEYLGAIARPAVRTLAVQFRRIVRDREIDPEDFTERNDARIECNLNRFGVAGRLRSDQFVMCSRLGAAGVARHDLGNAAHMLEHALHAPEATAGQHGRLARGRGGFWRVEHRNRNWLVDVIGCGCFVQTYANERGKQCQHAKAADSRIHLYLRSLTLSYAVGWKPVTAVAAIHQRNSERPKNAPMAPTATMPSVYQIATNGAALSLQ